MNRSYSKIRHIQESNNRLEKRLLGEQESDPKQNYLSKGYIDVTDGFKKKSYSLQIPDGTYKCDGMGYSFKIITNDGKDTGYVVTMMFGVRGMITGPLTVSNNGTNVSVDFGDFNRIAESILYNEKLNQVRKVIKEQEVSSDVDKYIVNPIIEDEGYKIVNELSLSDGVYNASGSGSVLYLYQNGKNTGYCIVATNGIRGQWKDTKVNVTNKTVQLPSIINTEKVYRILYNQSLVGQTNEQTEKELKKMMINKLQSR